MQTMQTTERWWTTEIPNITVGIDLGDRESALCVIDAAGEVDERTTVSTTADAMRHFFASLESARVVLEAGTHSPWVSRLIEEAGHEVIVANPSELYGSKRSRRKKTDRIDAEYLARVGRVDPALLYPIRHRGKKSREALAVIGARDVLVRSRTQLVNHVRGVVKSHGERLPRCSARSFARKVKDHLPEALRGALEPLLETIQELTERIRGYDREVERLSEEVYPETALLRQVKGVGALTALTYVLVIENPQRFPRNRAVASYLGLVPRTEESGGQGTGPELSISKTGSEFLRRLLVSSAHYILGPFGPDTDLRRWGQRLAARGGKNQKKRAVVAVARKLSVLLLSLWKSGEVYEPLRNSEPKRRSREQKRTNEADKRVGDAALPQAALA